MSSNFMSRSAMARWQRQIHAPETIPKIKRIAAQMSGMDVTDRAIRIYIEKTASKGRRKT